MHAADLHRLPDRGASAEQLFAHAPAQKHHAAPLQFVTGGDPAAFGWNFVAHLAVFRANAAYRGRAYHAVAIADAGTIHRLQADVSYQRSGLLDHVEVGLLQPHFLAGALSAGLLAGLLRPADHDALAESVEPAHQNAAEAAAVGDQQSHGGNAPDNAQHGQQAARVVALESNPGFENDFSQHVKTTSVHVGTGLHPVQAERSSAAVLSRLCRASAARPGLRLRTTRANPTQPYPPAS